MKHIVQYYTTHQMPSGVVMKPGRPRDMDIVEYLAFELDRTHFCTGFEPDRLYPADVVYFDGKIYRMP